MVLFLTFTHVQKQFSDFIALDPTVKPLTDEKLDSLEGNLERELREVGAYFPMRFIWGRKPEQ